MDLGLEGKHALVCASSRGLGKACAAALAAEGVHVVINGLDESRLAAAAEELDAIGSASVVAVQADINTEAGRQKLIDACPAPDILVNNNSGPPPGRFIDWERENWMEALEANLLAPAAMIRAAVPGMKERRFGRIVNITSAMVKSPRGPMGLSTTARTGLTALGKSLSAELAPHNVTINNLLPERFDTDRQRFMVKLAVEMRGLTEEEAIAEIHSQIPAGRMGRPEEFGSACAFLCAAQSGFITGQNLQMDGGAYAGLI